jgi:uracil-DNA glycosylase family 4
MTERGARRDVLSAEVAQPPGSFDPHCTRCARLAAYLAGARRRHPDYYAHPVPSFGDGAPRLLIVGLAPGFHGANRTGRPFTGDHAGVLLYETLHALGFANRPQSLARGDGFALRGVRIANAAKCAPPENKPLPVEVRNCNAYVQAELAQLPSVRVIVALGRIAHDAVCLALGIRRAVAPFAHGREHPLPGGRILLDSYHCSRYNTQTGRLTAEMFRAVMERARELSATGSAGAGA